MAVNILIGKQKFTSRSDRERERLQSQISTYALRLNADRDSAERKAFEQRLQAEAQTPAIQAERDIEDWLSLCTRIVERVCPCPQCGQVRSHSISCPELEVIVGV